MKIVVNRDELLDTLKVLKKVLPKTNISYDSPFQGILIEAENGVFLHAANLDLIVRKELKDVHIIETGSTLFFADKFISVVESFEDGSLILSKNEIIGKDKFYGMWEMDLTRFPTISHEPPLSRCELTVEKFLNFIEKTHYAADHHTGDRYSFVKFLVNGLLMKVTATDGIRLVLLEDTISESSQDCEFFIDFKSLKILKTFFENKTGKLVIFVREKTIGFHIENLMVLVTNASIQHYLADEMVSQMFRGFTKKIYLVKDKSWHGMKLEKDEKLNLRFSGSELQIFGKNFESVVTFAGDFIQNELLMQINPKFFKDAIKTFNGEVVFEFRDENSPLLIRTEDNKHRTLIMPIVDINKKYKYV